MATRKRARRLPIDALCAALCLALCGTAIAQEEPKPSEAQWSLNERALDAMEAEQFEDAHRLWSESLQQGEFNLFRLNQGRALQRMGRCDEARIALRKARSAPRVRKPVKAEIDAAIDLYLSDKEMGRLCPGRLLITCNPPETLVTIDGAPQGQCPERPIVLGPGPHKVRGDAWGDHVERIIEITGDDVTEVGLAIAPPAARAEAERKVGEAVSLINQSKLDEGAVLLAEAADLAPNWGEPRRRLGELADARGDAGAALKWMSQYLPFCQGPERVRVEVKIQELERRLEEERAELREAQAREEARLRYEAELAKAEDAVSTKRWWVLGGSAVVLGAGLAVDLIPDSGQNFEVDALDFVPAGLYLIGAAGLTWALLMDAEIEPPPELRDRAGVFEPEGVDRFYMGPERGWVGIEVE